MKDIAFLKDGSLVFSLTDHGVWLSTNNGDTFRELDVQRWSGSKSSESVAVNGNTIVASVGTGAKNALEVINDDSKFENYDGLPPGPCDENK